MTNDALERLCRFTSGDDANHLVRAYLDIQPREPDGLGHFEGRFFESLAGGGDRPNVRGVVGADDIVAVTMLGVTIPPMTTVRMLEQELGRSVSELLAEIPD